MAKNNQSGLYGVDTSKDDTYSQLKKDLTPTPIKIKNFLKGDGAWIIIVALLAMIIMLPPLRGIIEIAFLICFIIYYKNVHSVEKLPFKKPKSKAKKGEVDLNELSPANDKPTKPEGITFFGNERNTKKEIWFGNSDVRTHCLIFGTTGAGKALKMTEMVHTPNGWILNKDLRVGDKVTTPFGDSSIIGIYPQGKLELYNIKFSDDREIEVSADHLWEVHCDEWDWFDLGGGEKARAKVINTEELFSLVKNNSELRKFNIILSGEVFKEKRDLYIDPYLLGSALVDNEILNNTINNNGLISNDFLIGLKKYKLITVDKKINKFIPFDYKESSVQDRYSLLQGIMDTSGGVDSNGLVRFSSESKPFIIDIVDTVRSLGAIAKMTKSGSYYTVSIKHKDPSKLFYLKRKQTLNNFKDDNLKLEVLSVSKTNNTEECQCIKIEDPRGLFITKDYIVTHNTETMLSICVNSLNQASGFIYVDGKGDNELWAKIFSLVASRGRLDDLYIINFMTSHMSNYNKTAEKTSHTMNPCATAGADTLTELFVSLLPDSSGDGMWQGRASIYISSLIKPLVYLRDKGKLLLDVDVIRKHFQFEKTEELSQRSDIPIKYRDGLVQYVENLPGYVKPTPDNPNVDQPETVAEQHGYITMQFTETFGLLADTYGHIMKTQVAEVDFFDIVLNRRILVVLLPALEKSKQSLGNLGRIIVASIKNMMSSTLGSKVEGKRQETIELKPTKAPSPFMTIFDEYGYYSVKGAAVMPAQARSLGFFMIFAGQDYQAFKAGSEDDVGSIIANCKIKICMALEDPKETFEIFQKAAGQGKVAEVSSFEKDKKAMSEKYGASGNVSIQARDVIDIADLRNQAAGESHMLFRKDTRRLKHFYAEPKILDDIFVNSFLEVEPLDYNMANNYYNGEKMIFKKFDEILKNYDAYKNQIRRSLNAIPSAREELDVVFKFMKVSEIEPNLNEKMAFAISGYVERVEIINDKIVTEIAENLDKLNEYYDDSDEEKPEEVIDEGDDNLDFLDGYDDGGDDEGDNEGDKKDEELPKRKPQKENVSDRQKPSRGDSVSEDFSGINEGESELVGKIKERIKEKKKIIADEDFAYDLFEALNLDYLDIKDRISEMEYALNNKMYMKGLNKNKDRNKKEVSNLISENTLMDLTISAKPKRREMPKTEDIDALINELIGEDLGDL